MPAPRALSMRVVRHARDESRSRKLDRALSDQLHREQGADVSRSFTDAHDGCTVAVVSTVTPPVASDLVPYWEHPRVPSNVRETITLLTAWLVKAAGRAEAIQDPLSVSLEHLRMHGVAADVPKCPVSPCKTAGASLALYELATYAAQLVGGEAHLKFADAVEVFDAELIAAAQRLRPTFTYFRREMEARHHADERGGDFHAHALACVRVETLGRTIALLRHVTKDLSSELRKLLSSPLLWSGGRRVGRPPSAYLTAVVQHLASGGFEPAEMADLVVDGLGTKARAASLARLRRRIRDEDKRTVSAYPPMPVLTNEIPAGFRARANSTALGDQGRDERSRPCPAPTSSSLKSPKKRGPR